MSTTRKRDRIFALLGAVLFLVTASALTIAVVWSSVGNKSNNTTTTNTATNNCANPNIQPTAAAMAVPAAYQAAEPIKALQINDLTVGTGAAAKSGECLTVKYYGTLASNGTVFDENFTRPTAFAFYLGQGQVIPGWDQGMVGMKVGGERRLLIPASLGYGTHANGPIPANSDLVFDVKLLKVQ